MPGRSILSLVPQSNIVRPPGRLHEQHHVVVSGGNVLKPRLPLVCIPGMFLQHGFHLLNRLRALLLKDLVGNGRREHVAGDVPGRGGRGNGKGDKHERND
jgi:hypothetical protein